MNLLRQVRIQILKDLIGGEEAQRLNLSHKIPTPTTAT